MFIDGEDFTCFPASLTRNATFEILANLKEDLGSGSAAAVSGGVTSFLDMPNNKPSITDMDGMRMKLQTASEKCVNNYGFFIGATPTTCGFAGSRWNPDQPLAIPGFAVSRSSWVHPQGHLVNG